MTQVTLADAQARLPDLVAAAIQGEEVVITKEDQPAVKLVPIQPTQQQSQFGCCKGMLTILAEDDEHLEHFKDYMP